MKADYRTKDEIVKELERMKEAMLEVELCNSELRKYKTKLDKLLDSSPDALVFLGSENTITMANSQFEKMFGYKQDEIRGKDLSILIPERFRNKHRELVQSFFGKPGPRPMGTNLEIYGLKKNGEEFPVDIGLSLLKTEEEFFISVAIRDITERRESEKQTELDYFLQRALNEMLEISMEHLQLETQFERILDLILATPHLTLESKGAIYIVAGKPDVLILKASRGFEESPSYLCKEIPFGECICGKAASQTEIVHVDQVDSRHTRQVKYPFPHGHYCVPIVCGGKSVGLMNIYLKEGHKRSDKEEQFLSSVANTLALILNHNRVEMEKEELLAQLSDTEKLAALGRFTANVAHEIRNPLTSIGGLARRLQKRVVEGTKESEYAGFIASEVTILEKILKKVLSYSRKSSQEREAADIHEIIDSLLKLNEDNMIENNIEVKRSYSTLPDLLLDKTELHEAIENIIINAIDSMSPTGQLIITTGAEVVKELSYAFVRFRDTGAGMTDDQLKMIFEPFFTTKISEKGTGLGLPITKKIVEGHGGFITVESEVNRGSTFTLYFPF